MKLKNDESLSGVLQKDIKNDGSLTEVSQIGSKYSVKYDKILSSSEYVKMLPIIEYIEKYGCITTKEAMELTGKSNSSARRYLNTLVKKGILKEDGNTNNLKYIKIV